MIKKNHLVVLNAYKTFALCCLIVLDCLVWWLSANDRVLPRDLKWVSYVLIPYLNLFGWFALSFAFVSGFSLRLWLEQGWDSKRGGLKAGSFPKPKAILTRTLILFGIGLFLNYRSWYLFQLLAISTFLIILLLKRFNLWVLASVGTLVWLSSDPLRLYLQPWETDAWKAVLVGSKSGHYFWPIFPWFSLIVSGFLLGHFRLAKVTQNSKIFRLTCLLLGSVFINIAYAFDVLSPTIDLDDIWGPAIFQPGTLQFLGWMGLMFLSYGFFELWFSKKIPGKNSFFQVVGRNSLSIFLLHYALFAQLFVTIRNRNPWLLLFLIFAQYALGYLVGLGLERLRTFQTKQKSKPKLPGGIEMDATVW